MSEGNHLDVSEQWSLGDIESVFQGAELRFSEKESSRLDDIRAELISKIAKAGIRVYGFNTGFGDNRNRPTIETHSLGTIQDNIILSHAAGTGAYLDSRVVRLALAIRTHSLALGNSGIRGKLVSALCALANSKAVPKVPGYGSVGASGDLAPLSHLVLPLLGKGLVEFEGKTIEAAELGLNFDLKYSPSEEFTGAPEVWSTFGPKEGLALNNGTSFMTAHLALAVIQFENLIRHANLALALSTEAMCGVMDVHEEQVQNLRPYPEINECAATVRNYLVDSSWTVSRGKADPKVIEFRTVSGSFDSTQDDYCLRCGPVVHGTALRALNDAKSVVEIELNSVNDNPVIIEGEAFSGAHFHGMPLAFVADELRTAMAILGGICERRIAKLMNDKRNYGLPRHLTLDNPNGIKSGWMIAQYSAASMVNELKTRSMPYCVGNVTTGNESEDFVSMGSNSCRAAFELMNVLQDLIAIEIAAATRAIMIRSSLMAQTTTYSTSARQTIEAFERAGIEIMHNDDRPLNHILSGSASLISSLKFPI